MSTEKSEIIKEQLKKLRATKIKLLEKVRIVEDKIEKKKLDLLIERYKMATGKQRLSRKDVIVLQVEAYTYDPEIAPEEINVDAIKIGYWPENPIKYNLDVGSPIVKTSIKHLARDLDPLSRKYGKQYPVIILLRVDYNNHYIIKSLKYLTREGALQDLPKLIKQSKI